jgi:hypothetical protein
MSKLETNTIDNISGSSTLTVGDSNTSTISIPKNITLGASGTTITVPSGATITNNGTQTGFGGANTPMVSVDKTGGGQSISASTHTKVTLNTERVDSNSAFTSNTFTVPSGQAGKYFLIACARMDSLNGSSDYGQIQIANSDRSTQYATGLQSGKTGYGFENVSTQTIRSLSVGDTISLYCYGTEALTLAEDNCNLTIIKVIE